MNARTRSLADIRIVIGAVLSIIGLFLLFLIPFEYGVLHGAVAGILKTPTFTEIFGTVFAVLVLLGIPLLLGFIFFFPKGYKISRSKARKAGILLSR